MIINEIFYSIQGEGKWTGLPNIFIRTTGCNLRCSFCDTKYAYENGEELTTEQIKNKIKKHKCNHICITGGEPLLQKDITYLINELLKESYTIEIETNGSINIKPITEKEKLMISCDIKCPSSEMHKEMVFGNIQMLEKKDQLKFIIQDKKDYEYAKKIIKKYKTKCTILFQPTWKTNPKKLAEWILKDELNVRLGLQTHKIIWGNVKGK